MPPTPREKKASRITTACNPCRSRKQKCSGERPTCEQCLEYSRPCAWPEQLKRGPTKGYIENLEHRLHETENLLLRLLSHISDEQLSSILSEREPPNTNLNPLISLSRKNGGEHWKRFPLNSTENIRRWERDHSRGMGAFNAGADRRAVSSGDENRLRANREDVVGEEMSMSSGFEERGTTVFSQESERSETPAPPGRDTDARRRCPENRSRSYVTVLPKSGGGRDLSSSVPSTPHLVQALAPVAPSEPSSWVAAPPVRFQRQFLW